MVGHTDWVKCLVVEGDMLLRYERGEKRRKEERRGEKRREEEKRGEKRRKFRR
jgi:hypothetical protein